MFCFQCEQTAGGSGCVGKCGVCGKSDIAAQAQDELTGALITYAINGGNDYRLIVDGLFTTVTNVNFSPDTINALTAKLNTKPYDMAHIWDANEDIRSLKSLILFGLRGMAAYAYHARALGYEDDTVNAFFVKALALLGDDNAGMNELLPIVMETGKVNLSCMELLDRANTSSYGNPEPVSVPCTIESVPFIVITGHDLHDLELLLRQTEGKGINIYTHGEMLPAHGYPELKKYAHLKGNYGTAWQNQQKSSGTFLLRFYSRPTA